MFIMPIDSDCISNPLYCIKNGSDGDIRVFMYRLLKALGFVLDIRQDINLHLLEQEKITSPDSLLECYEYKKDSHLCKRSDE